MTLRGSVRSRARGPADPRVAESKTPTRALRGTLLGAGLVSLAAVGAGALLNLALAVAVGRGYGTGDTGVFFAAIGIFLVAGNGLKLGADTGVVRSVSRGTALGVTGDVKATLVVALVPVTLLATVTGGVVWAGAPWLLDTEEGTALLRSIAPFIPLFAVLSVLTAATRGLGGVGTFALLQNVLLPLTRLVGVVVAVVAGASIVVATWAWALGLPLLAVAAGWVLLRRVRALPGSCVAPASGRSLADVGREFWSFALPRAGSAAIEVALEWLDVALVAVLAGPEAAGVYAIATRLVKVPLLVEHAMRIAVAPDVAAALARGQREAVARLVVRVTVVMVAVVWCYLIVLIAGGETALGLFGPGFTDGVPLLAVLGVGMAVRAAAGPVQSVLLLGGLSRAQLMNKVIALAACLVGNLALTTRWGALGAAVVWSIVVCLDTALAVWQVRGRMGIPLAGVRQLTRAASAARRNSDRHGSRARGGRP